MYNNINMKGKKDCSCKKQKPVQRKPIKKAYKKRSNKKNDSIQKYRKPEKDKNMFY